MRRDTEEDGLDDDEDEMSHLRNARKYNEHRIAFGRNKEPEPQIVDEPQNDEDSEDAQFRAFFPTGFGKQKSKVDIISALEKTKRTDNDKEKSAPPARAPALSHPVGPPKPSARDPDLVGPPKPPPRDPDFIGPPRPVPGQTYDDSDDDAPSEKRNDDDDDDDDDEDDAVPSLDIPVSHEIELKGHLKPVSALALDPSGSRLLTGGFDYMVKFWDFQGMDSSLRSFRELEPCGGHQIRSLQFSITGDRFLVASGSAQPKIYDRDGFEICEFVKGDQYLSDMSNTKGHVAAISNALWHPNEKDTVMTSSIDGTIRLWNVNDTKKQKTVIKAKNARGTRTGVCCSGYGRDAKIIVGACQDGSLQLWESRGPFTRPNQLIRDAHELNTETSCVQFSLDGNTMITRGGDDTLKIWDLRKFNKPVHVIDQLPNLFAQTDCIFSPDDRFIVTGTSIIKNQGSGLLMFYDKQTFRPAKQLGMSGSSVIRILWHGKINQIVVGCSDAKARVLYDPTLSNRGAMVCVVRAPRQKDPFDYDPDRPILNPHTLPLFKPEPSGKRKREKERADPIKSRKPDIPTQGPGFGGRVGSSFTQHLLKSMGAVRPIRDEDPREAILKYANEADNNPYWFAAYKQTQPKPVFNEEEEEEEEKK